MRPLEAKLSKKLKKQLKKLNIHTQNDLICLMIGVVARRIGVEDISIKNWLEHEMKNLKIDYKRADDDVINILSQHDLSLFVSESDSFLNDMKRTETGSFYTPIAWVKYMTQVGLVDWVKDLLSLSYSESKTFIYMSLSEVGGNCNLSSSDLEKLKSALREIKVIDIACGAGAFLIEMVKCLTQINKFIDGALNIQTSEVELADHYISRCVHGIDLQVEPLAVYTLCLIWAFGCEDHWQFSPLAIQANSLEDGLFTKNTVLSSVMKKGGFDIVLGNPPYLGEKGNTPIFKSIRQTDFGKANYEGKMDLSYFFTLKSLEILNTSGHLVYLTTNYFITADGADKYRKKLKDYAVFTHILNFNSYPVFKEALGQHNMIYALKKKRSSRNDETTSVKYVLNQTLQDKMTLDYKRLLDQKDNSKYVNVYTCLEASLYNDDGTISILSDDGHRQALKAYEDFCDIKLKDEFQVNQGIVSGADQVSGLMLRSKLPKKNIERYNLQKGQAIFVFENTDLGLNHIERDCLRPFYKNSDIGEFVIQPRTERSIIYLDKEVNNIEKVYPKTIEHLKKFKPVLDGRREVRTGTRPWYALQWPRKPEVFEGPKIVVPQRSKVNRFAYTEQAFYSSADVYYFKADHLDRPAWYYYLGLLNSSIMYLWLYNNGKRKGELLELYAKPLLETSVPAYMAKPWQIEVSNRVASILNTSESSNKGQSFNEIKVYKAEIDQVIFKAMDIKQETIETIVNFRNRHDKA